MTDGQTINVPQKRVLIRLKGDLDYELTRSRIGCKVGDECSAILILNEARAAWFWRKGEWCVVWPDNYDLIEK